MVYAKEGKRFFFEKKNQKTLLGCRRIVGDSRLYLPVASANAGMTAAATAVSAPKSAGVAAAGDTGEAAGVPAMVSATAPGVSAWAIRPHIVAAAKSAVIVAVGLVIISTGIVAAAITLAAACIPPDAAA
jgi:hypothetical protein